MASNRDTIRKGIKELTSGITCVDNYSGKGRKKAEEHLTTLLEDIKNIVAQESQTDPSFKSRRLYTRLTAAQVRKQLIEKYGYSDEVLPTFLFDSSQIKWFRLQPQTSEESFTSKKIPQTDAIFEELAIVNQNADSDPSVLRLSLDAKARVNIGTFDRGGRNTVKTETFDHDFQPKNTVTPYGIFLPKFDELFLYFTESKVTSDFIVDVLEDFWLGERHRFSQIETLVLN